MHAYEFSAEINDGKIVIPDRYRKKIGRRVKVIVLTDEDNSEREKVEFTAVKLKTKDFKFDRGEANER